MSGRRFFLDFFKNNNFKTQIVLHLSQKFLPAGNFIFYFSLKKQSFFFAKYILFMKMFQNLRRASNSFFGKYWFTMALAGLFLGAILRAGFKAEAAERQQRPSRPAEKPIVVPTENEPPIRYTQNIGVQATPTEMKIFPKPGGSEPILALDEAKAMDFLKRFAKVAVGERKKYGIPASVILGSALVQSAAGSREQAREANNFFNLPDGSPAQIGVFFDKNGQKYARFKTPWDSFRANSISIDGRFAALKTTAGGNRQAWIAGLSRGGYSSLPDFEHTLQKAIEDFHLDELDR